MLHSYDLNERKPHLDLLPTTWGYFLLSVQDVKVRAGHTAFFRSKEKAKFVFSVSIASDGAFLYRSPGSLHLILYHHSEKENLAQNLMMEEVIFHPDSAFIVHAYLKHSEATSWSKYCLHHHIKQRADYVRLVDNLAIAYGYSVRIAVECYENMTEDDGWVVDPNTEDGEIENCHYGAGKFQSWWW